MLVNFKRQFGLFQVRGYLPASTDVHSKVLNVEVEQENYRELVNRRQNLLLELKNYDQNRKVGSTAEANKG